jgi:thymidylate synthase ThyX
MIETFAEEEARRLGPYFTNLDAPVFGLKLPQEVAGALFSRYSRSTKGLRRTFLDEFLGDPDLALQELLPTEALAASQETALRKAREFYDRVLVGYGDDSVAQLGGAHLACEQVSNVAAKLVEDSRIGIAPLEKSTRYVRFDQKDEQGEYLFYREPRLMASAHRDEYLRVMRLLFDTYASQVEPMIRFVRGLLPIEAAEVRHPQTGEPLTYAETASDARLRKWAESAYRSTVRAHACDVLRGYLPAATLTNVGLFGVGQAYEYLLTKLYSHDLTEARELAAAMHGELNKLIPSFVKRARASEYLTATASAARAQAARVLPETTPARAEAVTLVDCDREAEEKIVAAILYPWSRQPLAALRQAVGQMPSEERSRLVEDYLGRRRHRRDKPGRAFEQVYYTFDFLGNLGLYRDLQRHRILTQERQDFTVIHGFDTPPEIREAGLEPAFARCMEAAADLYHRVSQDLPREAQYVVPFAYRVRWYMKLNLREAVHIAELRTMAQGHPDYRAICQAMWRQIEAVHPTLARYAKFIDWNTYRLGRLQSELRTEYKRSALAEDPSQ